MKNKIIFIVIIILVFMILLIPLKGSYAFYSDNKDLEIINTKVGDWNTLLGYLRMNDKNNNLSRGTPGDMYRYQGTDDVANWICFGTTDNCGLYDDDIDKYMYRIIGITEEGQLKLLKETFLKEGNNYYFQWHSKSQFPDCLEEACEWSNVDLFKRINGISNGDKKGNGLDGANTDIFVDSEYYDYLKSGDSYNGTKDGVGSSWYQLIESHDWMYGDTKIPNNLIKYNGNDMYAIETGNSVTKRSWPDEGQMICSIESPCTEKDYTWSKSINAKIGLMYMHDVDYAYTGGNPENNTNIANSWIHFQKDGYNTSTTYEWFTTRSSVKSTSETYVAALVVWINGAFDAGNLIFAFGVRPVFYLNPNVNIKEGKGTKTDPFILT